MLQGFEQRLQVNGKTGRGIARTITAQKMIVPAPTTDAIAQVGGETLEGNTRVVMQLTDIAEVDEHTVFETVGFEHIIDLGEIFQRRLGLPALAQIGSPM